MERFRRIEGKAYPLGISNVDTDVIIGAEYLKSMSRNGLGAGAFAVLRGDPANIFDDPRYKGAPILIAGENFGCGSSREHAAWALLDMGVRVVIAPSFSDIFTGNAAKNGILTVTLPRPAVDRLIEATRDGAIFVDLETCVVKVSERESFPFAIEPFRRECLLAGLDEIAVTLAMDDAITSYELAGLVSRPWLSNLPGKGVTPPAAPR